MLDRTRRMQEFKIAKDRFVQVYMDEPDFGILSFYNGARADVATVAEFAEYQTSFSVCAFYSVPYPVIEEFLTANVL